MGGGGHRQDLPERQALAAAVGAARAARPGEPAAGGPAGLLPVQLGAAAELVVAELVAVRVPGEQPNNNHLVQSQDAAAASAVALDRRHSMRSQGSAGKTSFSFKRAVPTDAATPEPVPAVAALDEDAVVV